MSEDVLNRLFGAIFFDDPKEPTSGWAFAAGGEKREPWRVAGINELSTDTIWWTNISYDSFFRNTEIWRSPWLRHEKYLVVGPKNVIQEWGYDPAVTPADFQVRFCAEMFSRVMRLAFSLVRELDPKLRMDTAFVAKTLRDDLRCLLPELEYPRGDAAAVMKSGHAWDEFSSTAVRTPKGSKWVMVRKPRISYAIEMLQTPVPKGPYDLYDRKALRDQAEGDRVAWIKGLTKPVFSEIAVTDIHPDVAPIYGFGNSADQGKRVPRSWVAHPEFALMSNFAKMEVRSCYIGDEMKAMFPDLHPVVSSFLVDRYSDYSWTAGIIAETIWRAVGLPEDKAKVGIVRDGEDHAHTSWQGAWIKSSDKTQMYLAALKLHQLEYSVKSYGLGWIMVAVREEEFDNFLRDALGQGLVPNMCDVPEGMFQTRERVGWGGDPRSAGYAQYTVTGQRDLMYALDQIPILPPSRRQAAAARIAERLRAA